MVTVRWLLQIRSSQDESVVIQFEDAAEILGVWKTANKDEEGVCRSILFLLFGTVVYRYFLEPVFAMNLDHLTPEADHDV